MPRRRAASTVSPTVTLPGAVEPPPPRNERPPLAVNRSTATVSSQSSVASTRIRAATGAQSGVHRRRPGHARDRAAPSASRLAARIIILDGTQPQYGHSPADQLGLDPDDVQARLGQPPGDVLAPGPMPTTTTSTASSGKPASP